MKLVSRLAAIDAATTTTLRRVGHTPTTERVVVAYAWAGESGALWIVIGLAGAIVEPRRRAAWLAMVVAVPTALTANYAVKLVARRPRPDLDDLPALGRRMHTDSFPSGHAATAFAAVSATPALRGPMLVAAAAMALTRPFLGVHYLSDVLGGSVLGAVVGRAARRWGR